MEKSNRLKLYPAIGLFKLAALFSHVPVRHPPKASDILLKGAVNVAEFAVGNMNDYGPPPPAANSVPNRLPGNTEPAISDIRSTRTVKDRKAARR